MVNEILLSSIRRLSRFLIEDGDSCTTLEKKWQDFIGSAIVTYITGENPNPSDSGHFFTRKVRAMGIAENQIKTPEQVCYELERGLNAPILIVDDFVGSANQFIQTCDRHNESSSKSLGEFSAISPSKFFLCSAFCTEYALGEIKKTYPNITVHPGHLIPNNYSALVPDSIVWPPNLRASAVDFIHNASLRAGIPDTRGSTSVDWRGFAKLSLTIAFEGSIPDATLPIFYWEQNGWNPLLRRT